MLYLSNIFKFFNKKYLYYLYLLYLKYSFKFIYFLKNFKKIVYKFKYQSNLDIDKLINIFINLKFNNIYILDIDVKFNFKYFLDFVKKFFNFKYKESIDSNIKINLLKYTDIIEKDFINLNFIYNKNNIILILKSYKLLFKIIKNKDFITNFNIIIIFLDDKFNYNNIINNFLNKNNIIKNLVFKDCKIVSYLTKINLIRKYNEKKFRNFIDFKIDNKQIPDINFLIYLNNIIPNINKLIVKKNKLLDIKPYLEKKLYNQNEVIELIASSVNNLFTNLNDRKILGSWLLCGPSGTGKTELVKILTYALSGSLNNLIKFNMSEYMEPHSISKLIGSPPGYIGYGEENIIFNKIKLNKFSIILFDEIEKANKNINDLMLQILDEGRLTLSNGNVINFNKTFIIFTSNLGYSSINMQSNKITNNFILNIIEDFFRIEFLNRLNDIIIFKPISEYNHIYIINKFINDLIFNFKFNISLNKNIKSELIKYFYNILYGARPIKRINEFLFNKLVIFNKLLNNNYFYNINLLYNLNGCNIFNRFNSYIYTNN